MPDMLYDKFPDKHYAIFTMNRPERLNALGRQMWADQSAALQDFNNDPEMRAGILTGKGRAFSAGADLKEMAERNARTAEVQAQFDRNEISNDERNRIMTQIQGFPGGPSRMGLSPKPIIAAINGLCLAGGMERSIDCDIRIASTEAYFGLFEVKRGIIAGYAVQHLARVMPFGEVMHLLLTADTMSVQEAYRLGFVHEVVEPDQLMPRAIEMAERIAANAPLAVQASKAVAHFWRQYAMGESEKFFDSIYRNMIASEDAKEGPRAFAEKREPVWKAR